MNKQPIIAGGSIIIYIGKFPRTSDKVPYFVSVNDKRPWYINMRLFGLFVHGVILFVHVPNWYTASSLEHM